MLSKAVCARVAAACCLAFMSPSWAMPIPVTGSTVDGGVFEWSTFDIAEHESIDFEQSTHDSIILARISSDSPTRIAGSLTTNGSLFLVNPNGFYFDVGSSVSINRLYLSTDPLAFDSFLQGSMSTFGTSQGQNVALAGSIDADFVGVWAGGNISLLSGATITASHITLASNTVDLESGATMNMASRDSVLAGDDSFQLDESRELSSGDTGEVILLSGGALPGGDLSLGYVRDYTLSDFVRPPSGGSLNLSSGGSITASSGDSLALSDGNTLIIMAVPEPDPLTTLLTGLGILSIVSLRRNRSS